MPGQRETSAEHRFVVIGTPRAVLGALAQVRGAGIDATSVLGAVIVGGRDAVAERAIEAPILGVPDDLERLHTRFGFEHALVSLPRAMDSARTRLRTVLAGLGVNECFLPTIEDVLGGAITAEPVRTSISGEIDMAALVGRTPRRLDLDRVRRVVGGKRVMVTGAGGSIGSELARICAGLEPETLILMDRSDNALFEIDREIGARFPKVKRKAVLHDVVDADATLRRLVSLRPQVVLHAAAHKHVPLMEDHPAAAVTNNLFGTKSIADAALAVGVERFVMISTDKAVNPSSVMGATKRLAEIYIRSLNAAGTTKFSLVRFGNVLGSACSVLPIWGRQLAEGGPMTVTHPEMTRFFMTIPEAAALVMQAASIDTGSRAADDVFILDMGEPVRILDLAKRFARAHGFEPVLGQDLSQTAGGRPVVRIAMTGPRPGEKLHEELAYQMEELTPTGVSGVMCWAGTRPDRELVTQMVADLSEVRQSQDAEAVIRAIQRHVPDLRRGDVPTAGVNLEGSVRKLSPSMIPDQKANATAA